MQETADNSNQSKNSQLKDNLSKQENIKIHGIGLDKAGRCTHYHTQLDIAALLCAKCRKYYACYSCHDELEDHSFVATTPEEAYPVLCGNCGRKLTLQEYKKAAALTATQDLIQNAVYMRIFISVVQIQRIQNSKNFVFSFICQKSDILIKVRIN